MELKAKVDSYVVKSPVHFPTDINLLWDAMRRIIILTARVSDALEYSGWRQWSYNLKKVKSLLRKITRMKHSTSQNEEKRVVREALIVEAYQNYMNASADYIEKAESVIADIRSGKISNSKLSMTDYAVVYALCDKIEKYIVDAKRQMDQIERRIMQGEKIPHGEKLFSLFERHVEWISKGKAGVPQELGVRLCVVEDQYGFILHHRVMFKETDDKVTIPIIWDIKNSYPGVRQCSFDKSFYSPENKAAAKELIETVIMPKKGRLNKKEQKEEYSESFQRARKAHSGIESAINGLTHGGLSKCRDKGNDGHERYVAFGIVARNIHNLGNAIIKQEEATQNRKKKYRKTQEQNLKKRAA